ncbi:MAG: glycoside hydrolase family 5 protein [Verrucomicrobia subdivision 3 bacterium]|nr:glycoside hydrolase family 5 protein [Limisphaerales bacterium]
MPIAWGQTNPVKVASTARLDLVSPTVILTNGQVVAGEGQIKRPDWLGAGTQQKSYSAEFPINHFGWREVAVRFVPTAGGEVECKLMGPWQQTANGRLYKQEVLWDRLEVTGAPVTNAGFEDGTAGWRGGSVITATAETPAVEGRHYGRAWHNQPLTRSIEVSAGVPVTLRLHARAMLPEGYPEMRRIMDRNTPAHVAARRFMRGANFGNYLEVPPRQTWSVKHTTNDLMRVRAEGFDHVRIPCGWHHYTGPGPEHQLREGIFDKVDVLVTNALTAGLSVLVNVHHFDAFTSDPAGQKEKFLAIWRQIAAHYADAPEGLAFELLNEPRDKATTAIMNPIYAQAIAEIRKSNPQRTIFVGPGKWNAIDELPQLILPNDDANLIVTVHSYDPFYFTHQGANWTKPATDTRGIVFPGPPATPVQPATTVSSNRQVVNWIRDYNTLPPGQNPSSRKAFAGKLRAAKEWSEYYGRPIHVGEFGCFTSADAGSRARYYAEFRRALNEHGIGWAIWDWKAGFRYWDEAKGQPMPGMREALFGP